MYTDGDIIGEAPLEINKVEAHHDGESHGTFVQILVGTEQISFGLSATSLEALDDLCSTLYSYALTTTFAENWQDVDANLSERQYYNEILDLGFVVNEFDVNKLSLDFYSFPKKKPIDLAIISFTGKELKGFVMHVAALFGLDSEFGDPADAQKPTLGNDPFAE